MSVRVHSRPIIAVLILGRWGRWDIQQIQLIHPIVYGHFFAIAWLRANALHFGQQHTHAPLTYCAIFKVVAIVIKQVLQIKIMISNRGDMTDGWENITVHVESQCRRKNAVNQYLMHLISFSAYVLSLFSSSLIAKIHNTKDKCKHKNDSKMISAYIKMTIWIRSHMI